MVLASVSVALGKLSPMTKLENIVSFEPWSCVGMLTPGLPSWSVSAGLPTASWPTLMLKLGRLTGSPTVRFCTGDVWSFTSNAVMLVGMLTTRLPSVVAVLTRQNSRCDDTVLPLVELKMRRTMSMFAALAPMSGTVIVPVVVTCEANVPSRLIAGGASGVGGGGGASGVLHCAAETWIGKTSAAVPPWTSLTETLS